MHKRGPPKSDEVSDEVRDEVFSRMYALGRDSQSTSRFASL